MAPVPGMSVPTKANQDTHSALESQGVPDPTSLNRCHVNGRPPPTKAHLSGGPSCFRQLRCLIV